MKKQSKWKRSESKLRALISENKSLTPKQIAFKYCEESGEQYSESLRVFIHRMVGNCLRKKSDKKAYNVEEEPKSFILSAWSNEGRMLDIDEYCERYNLPRNDIRSYKLVTHTGTPYYNILFKDHSSSENESMLDIFESMMKSKINSSVVIDATKYDVVDRLIWTDVHVGMDASREGLALYAADWNENTYLDRISIMASTAIREKRSDSIIVDNLGDFTDGWNGETVRGGHKLPQNMSNEQAFDVALKSKVMLADKLHKKYSTVVFNDVVEDNHSGAFGYVVSAAFKAICENRYDNVSVVIHRKFISWYTVCRHAFVITHG